MLSFSNFTFAQSGNILLTKIITENISIKSESELIQKFSKKKDDLSFPEKNELDVICKVLLANLISNQENNISKKSLDLYENALKIANESNNIGLQIWVESQFGFYFYKFYKYDKASNYFLKASRLLQEYPDVILVDPITVLKYNSYFFTSINEKQLSNRYLKRALNFLQKSNKEYPVFLNALGNNYYDLGEINLAAKYLNETIISAKSLNDSLRLAKGLGDLSQVYIYKKDYNEAEKLLLEDIKISKFVNNVKNTIFAEIRLAKMYFAQQRYNEAKKLFSNALEKIDTQSKLQNWELEINKYLLSIALVEKNQDKELLLRRKIDALRPVVDTIDGAEILKKISWKNENEIANWKFETEKAKLEQASLLKTTFIIISLLLLSILILAIFIFKRRFKLQQIVYENSLLNSQIEKFKAEQSLIEANNSLKDFKVFLTQKNNEIIKLENSLKQFEDSSLASNNDEKLKLENLISSHLMTDDNWKAFKSTFIKDESEFYNDILLKFEDISDSSLRLIMLHKIGLKNQEIAKLLGITIHGVKKAKQRLRIKYGEAITDLI